MEVFSPRLSAPEPLTSNILHPPNHPFTRKMSISVANMNKRNSMVFDSAELPNFSKYKNSIKICRIPPEHRTAEEIQLLIKNTSTMQYFQEMNRKNSYKSEKIHERICVVLRYESKKKGEIVFNVDEPSNKFYIILSGTVNILIPKSRLMINKEKNDLTRLAKRYFNKITKTKCLKNDDSNSNSESDSDSDNPLKDNELKTAKLKLESDKYKEQLGGISLNDVNIKDIKKLYEDGILIFTNYISLKEGFAFGELGILTGKLRSATIICKEDAHFAVMEENDYKNIVSVIERKKIFDKFEFFKTFLIKEITNENLRKLSYAFEKIKFSRGEFIFKEGEIIKNIYVIKRGEVQIQKFVIDYNKLNYQKKIEKGFEKKMPINIRQPTKQKIIMSILNGEILGEDELFDNNNFENIETSRRKYSAFVISSKATIFSCPIQFFKKFLFERPQLHNKFREKYLVKKEIRKKQLENCLREENMIYNNENSILQKGNSNQNLINFPNSIKKSLSDYKFKFKHLSWHATDDSQESIDNLLDVINNSEKNNKYGFFSNKNENFYRNKIEKRINFIEKSNFSKQSNDNIENDKTFKKIFSDLNDKTNKNLDIYLNGKFRKKGRSNKSESFKSNYFDETSKIIKNLKKQKLNNLGIDFAILNSSINSIEENETEEIENNFSKKYNSKKKKIFINIVNPICFPKISKNNL